MNAKLATNDLEAFWMPFTANRQYKKAPRLLVSAEGMYYTAADGRRVLDGTSGLWCVNAGHCRPKIVEAVRKQVGELDFAGSFQMGHPSAFECAAKLVNIAPPGFDHVFFTNSGSELVETALKIALAYHRAKGNATKTRLIGRERGYHGVNFGGTSVGGILNNRKMFGTLLSGVDHIRHTHDIGRNAFSRGEPEHGAELADDLERLVALHDASTIAAVIVEPVACSTGVLIPPKGYLKRLAAICAKHDILLIFDEVITAFGRLGTPFGADYFGVLPDIITTAKGITNGTVPMGAVFVTGKVHDAFMNGPRGSDRLLPRLYLFRAPGRLRRLDRDARSLQGGGVAHPRGGACALLARGAPLAERPSARHRCPQYRADRRRRVRSCSRRADEARAHALRRSLRARPPGAGHRRHHRARRAGQQ